MLSSDAPGLQFSISHAREAVAVAVAREPIGVDLEPLRELDQLEEMSDLVLAAEERALLSRAPEVFRSRLFLRYWTLKEALLKAAARGFTIPPNTIVIDAGNIPAVISVPAALEATAQWQFIAPALDPQLAEWINGAA
jgi:4'-phosphopantetheinyl transferase